MFLYKVSLYIPFPLYLVMHCDAEMSLCDPKAVHYQSTGALDFPLNHIFFE